MAQRSFELIGGYAVIQQSTQQHGPPPFVAAWVMFRPDAVEWVEEHKWHPTSEGEEPQFTLNIAEALQ
jgi:hypothetical protein